MRAVVKQILTWSVYCLILLCIKFLFFDSIISKKNDHVINIYGWYGVIPQSVIKDFEQETGIRVRYDMYDSNEIVEAKLLAGSSGYDIIFPSFFPYAARQISIGLYRKIDFSKIPNAKHIMSEIYNKIGHTQYAVPFFWGTIGIAVNTNIVEKVLQAGQISYDMIFVPSIASKISKYGISFPQEVVDIYYQTLIYLQKKTFEKTSDNLNAFVKQISSIRKYIKKFSSETVISDMLSGEICVGIASSDNVYRAIKSSKNANIRYILPANYGILWIDCMCIPKNAKHIDAAHKFINFLLRSDIAYRITKFSGILTTIKSSVESFRQTLRDADISICPTAEEITTLHTPKISISMSDKQYDRALNNIWCKIRMGNMK